MAAVASIVEAFMAASAPIVVLASGSVPAGVGGAGAGRLPGGAGVPAGAGVLVGAGAVAGFGSPVGAGYGARRYSASGATRVANNRNRLFGSRMALSKMTCRGNL